MNGIAHTIRRTLTAPFRFGFIVAGVVFTGLAVLCNVVLQIIDD